MNTAFVDGFLVPFGGSPLNASIAISVIASVFAWLIFTRLRLVPNWRDVLKYAWSVKLILVACALSAIEAALPFVPELYMVPRGLFALLTLAIAFAALFARFVAQRSISGGKQQ
ncbi:MAG: hypothetical protein KF750_14310 [Xanthobacteraceae bacterium]|nr:hypothetical protein [Xanthobacteraceae bacterium]